MITLIEALNYRCLRYVRQPLGPFQILVGPNATGKSTLLDVVPFLGRLTTDGLQAAISERTSNIYDLFWQREGESFELAIEAAIPERKRLPRFPTYDTFRYEVAIELAPAIGQPIIRAERGFLRKSSPQAAESERHSIADSESIITELEDASVQNGDRHENRYVLVKEIPRIAAGGIRVYDSFYSEDVEEYSSRQCFSFGPQKSALGNLPEDETKFPAATWFKQLLSERLTPYQLDGRQLHSASRPALPHGLQADAANLPWVVADLREKQPAAYEDWLAHLRIALPDLAGIDTVLREDDRHRYLMLEYGDSLRVPSWSVSEGTLRLIALTLPAYLKDWHGTLLIEEPENGLHPLAIETAYQSLSSVYDAQVLMATHSPLLVGLAKPSAVLCFSKDSEGATQIVSGDRHPRLADWHGEVDLGTLFASGVLG